METNTMLALDVIISGGKRIST